MSTTNTAVVSEASPQTIDVNVRSVKLLPSPQDYRNSQPTSAKINQTIFSQRETISNILARKDPRFLMIVGPCSVHNVEAAELYAQYLVRLRGLVADQMEIVMRVYFEKPRTSIGWRGLINDPDMNGSYDMEKGLRVARGLLLTLAELGMPVATEFLEPIIPAYIADLVSWGCVGARTIESQTHRQMASGLSMSVGMKNPTDGSIKTVIEAMKASKGPQAFLGVNSGGQCAVICTKGNPTTHLVLRGSNGRPNYEVQHVMEAGTQLALNGVSTSVVIDCSHQNCSGDFRRQREALQDVIRQVCADSPYIVGAMLESNLMHGNQAIPDPPTFASLASLNPHISVTDKCLGWEETERLILSEAERLR